MDSYKTQHRPQVKRLWEAVDSFSSSVSSFVTSLPFYKLIPTPSYKRLGRSFDVMYDIGELYVKEHMEQIGRRPLVKKRYTHYTASLLEQWLTDDNLNQDEIIGDAVTLLVAALDIVSVFLFLTLLIFLQHRLLILQNWFYTNYQNMARCKINYTIRWFQFLGGVGKLTDSLYKEYHTLVM